MLKLFSVMDILVLVSFCRICLVILGLWIREVLVIFRISLLGDRLFFFRMVIICVVSVGFCSCMGERLKDRYKFFG